MFSASNSNIKGIKQYVSIALAFKTGFISTSEHSERQPIDPIDFCAPFALRYVERFHSPVAESKLAKDVLLEAQGFGALPVLTSV
ncbi:MAG: hypothetical protein K0U16_07920 [Gammaproteobacteria bacterium]|nr:hypothetical protein [Gammaproteobacteria bacterium]